MTPFFQRSGTWLRRRAENVLAAMMAVVFVAFVLQIAFRYFFNFPIGWTSELTVVGWLWLVLWSSAFVAEESQEIGIDLVSGSVGRRTRQVMGIITAVAIVILYAASLPATIRYVSFMKVEHSSYLNIRMDVLFSIYVFFVAAVIVRYVWILWQLLRGKSIHALDSTDTG